MIEVPVTPWDTTLAHLLSSLRHHVNRVGKVVNQKIGPQSEMRTDLDGMLAELAFCRAFNYYPDLTITPRAGGWDAVARTGQTVDVKATRHADGKLLAAMNKERSDADLYVLAIVSDTSVRFVGWATAEELLAEKNIVTLGYGPVYALPQDKLRPFRAAKKAEKEAA